MAEQVAPPSAPGVPSSAWRWLEVAAVAAYLLLATAYVLTIPYGQAPDEEQHLACVRSLAERGRLPALPNTELARQPGRIISDEAQQPPLYYLLMAPLWLAAGGQESWFYPLARAFSVLIGLAAILFTRGAVRTVLPDRPDVLALGTIFAGTFGTYNYVMATLNNEVLAVLVFALGLWFAAQALVADRPLVPLLWLGAMIGLALLVKLTATCLLAALLVVVWAIASRPGGARRWARALGLLAAAIGVALAIGGWWSVRNVLVYGQAAPRAHYRPNFWNFGEAFGLPELSVGYALVLAESAVRSVWGPEWLLRRHEVMATVLLVRILHVPARPHSPTPTILPLALLIAGIWGAVRLTRGYAGAGDGPSAPLWLLRAVGAAWLWLLLGLTSQTLFVDRHVSLFVGRYLPVVLPALGVVMGMGVAGWAAERHRLPVAVAVLLAQAGYGAWVLLAVAAKHAG